MGRTEREVVLALESAMRELGARATELRLDRCCGRPRRAAPRAGRATWRSRSGQLVVIDWGAQVDGYCSDCTRTVATGELDDQAKEVYALVSAAQLAGVEAVRAGGGRPRHRRRGQRSDRARRLRRALRSRAGARRRDGGPRGPPSLPALRGPSSRSATSSPSSRGSTFPACSASASRIWSWSPNGGARSSPPCPRSCARSIEPVCQHRRRR